MTTMVLLQLMFRVVGIGTAFARGWSDPPTTANREPLVPSERSRALIRTVRLALVLVAFGCLAPSTATAQEWYELYAGGEQALRNNQPQRAADLLQRAIQQRPRPGVAVPTYGTNFEPRYFPYLRLAEAYIRVDAYEDALKALETSARFGVEPLGCRQS